MGQTLYQKVKAGLIAHGPITFANLADKIQRDQDSVRMALIELRRRGKATHEKNRVPEARLWKTC